MLLPIITLATISTLLFTWFHSTAQTARATHIMFLNKRSAAIIPMQLIVFLCMQGTEQNSSCFVLFYSSEMVTVRRSLFSLITHVWLRKPCSKWWMLWTGFSSPTWNEKPRITDCSLYYGLTDPWVHNVVYFGEWRCKIDSRAFRLATKYSNLFYSSVMKVACFAFVMNRSHEYIGHKPISYLGIMWRDLSSFFFLFFLFSLTLLLFRVFPNLRSTQPTYTANHVDCILQPSPTSLSSNPQPSYTSFQSYRTTYVWKVIPYRIENSVILFDVESLLDLHAPPMAPTTQSTLDIISKSMGIKGQLRHLQRNFGIGLTTGQPNYQLYAFVILQAIEIVLKASQ